MSSHHAAPRRLGLPALTAVAATLVLAMLLLAWLALLGGAGHQSGCQTGAAVAPLQAGPMHLRPIFDAAALHYHLGARGSAILAGLTSVESDFGRNLGPSSAGAVGWTQFMPATWRRYGVDADGDGRRDPDNPADAIFAAARYLGASGAPADWYQALFAYNHADWYVAEVLHRADQLAAGLPLTGLDPTGCAPIVDLAAIGVRRIRGGGRLVAIPGFPGQRIDERILPDVEYLTARYHLAITAAYAPTGHATGGEHPLGLAVDLVPGPGGSWDDVDRLAHWAEPIQGAPRPPFRWVGYDGDPGHGRGNHLHLSWDHSPTPSHRPPAEWVLTLELGGGAA